MTSTDRLRVYVVDDDQSVVRSLCGLLTANGFETTSFNSAEEFLETYEPENAANACLLLDLRMPGMTGLELQRELNSLRCALPIVMLTGHGDIAAAVNAMKAGAVDFLEKPATERSLLCAIDNARLLLSDTPTKATVNTGVVAHRLGRLTEREREILQHLVLGKSNREIGAELNISTRTVENHRARIREKMEANGVSDLIKMMKH